MSKTDCLAARLYVDTGGERASKTPISCRTYFCLSYNLSLTDSIHFECEKPKRGNWRSSPPYGGGASLGSFRFCIKPAGFFLRSAPGALSSLPFTQSSSPSLKKMKNISFLLTREQELCNLAVWVFCLDKYYLLCM